MEKEVISVPNNNPSTYCRLCFAIGDRNLVPLFPSDAEPRHFLIEQISEFTGIQIRPREDAFGHICWRCAVMLEDFQLFRQRSLEHDVVIRVASVFDIEIAGDIKPFIGTASTLVSKSHSEKPGTSNQQSKNVEFAQIIENDQNEPSPAPASVLNGDQAASLSTQMIDEDDECSSSDSSIDEGTEPVKTPTCHICKIEFGSQQAMFAHFKEQHSDRGRPHKCSLCPAAFKRKGHLEDHVSSHLGTMRYECKDCGAKYAKAKSLLRHRKLYHLASLMKSVKQRAAKKAKTDDPQFKCLYCPKAFKHRPSLNFHIKSHYEMLSHVCDICDARFANEQGMLVHKGKYHPQHPVDKFFKGKEIEKLSKCDFCPRFFKHKKYLTVHINHMHYAAWREKLDNEKKQSNVDQLKTSDTEG